MSQQARQSGRVSFQVCKRCGLHGWIMVYPREDRPHTQVSLFPQQPEVWSQEAAIHQMMDLVRDGYIDESEAQQLLKQILSTLLSPTEEAVDHWQSIILGRVANPLAQGASNE